MIHSSKKQKAKYLFNLNKFAKKLSVFLFAIIGLFIVSLVLIYVDVIPTKNISKSEEFSSVALVYTPTGMGTAFKVSDSYLITARHVIEELEVGELVDLVFVKQNNKETQAELYWKYDKSDVNDSFEYDFALLKFTNPSETIDIPILNIGMSSSVGISDEVILIGYPNGEFMYTKGAIGDDEYSNLPMFKVDASAWPGSSGAPLLNADTKEVIGILVGGHSDEFQGINMACKIDVLINTIQTEGINIYE